MAGHWLGVCTLFLTGIFGIWQARLLPLGSLQNPGPGFFPFWISLILCGLAALSLVSMMAMGRRKAPPIQWPGRSAWLRIFFSLLLFTGYALTFERLGYVLSTILLTGFFVKIGFHRSWLGSALFGVLAVLAMYGLFVWLLGIRLPTARWWQGG